MSSLDQFLAGQTSAPQADVIATIRKLGANKDLRIFLTALCKYSKADWASFMRSCRVLYSVLQSSMLIKSDSKLADEFLRVPHIAVFFRRCSEET